MQAIDCKAYLEQSIDLYQAIFNYIQSETDDEYTQLFQLLDDQNYTKNPVELKNLLRLLSKITKNHYRQPGFFNRIQRIISNIKKHISFPQDEILTIFKSNKMLLLLLIKEDVLQFDDTMYNFLSKLKPKFLNFFYSEIKSLNNDQITKQIETDLLKINQNNLTDFEAKRERGVNDSPLCEIIRRDSLQEFTQYVTQSRISLDMKIERSVFETNPYLLKKDRSLIEYAVFYGSISIFRYLKEKVTSEIESSIVIDSVHSNKIEMIQEICDSYDFSDNLCLEAAIEAIKCHHNDFVDYFIEKTTEKIDESNDFIDACFRFYNYAIMPEDIKSDEALSSLVKYDFSKYFFLLIKSKAIDIKSMIIQNFFYSQNFNTTF